MKNCNGIILCGGKGSRLQEAGKKMPKALFKVNDKPILAHALDHFVKYEIEDITLCVGHLGHEIETYCKRHYSDLNITFDNAGSDASMLKRLESGFSSQYELSIVAYGDTFIDIDYRGLIKKHKERSGEVTILTGKSALPWGVIDIGSNDKVTNFNEKPQFTYYLGGFVASNSFFVNIRQDLSTKPDSEGLLEYFNELVDKGLIYSFNHTKFNITFNNLLELNDAREKFHQYMTMDQN